MKIKIKKDVATLPTGVCECMCEGCEEPAKYRAPQSPEEPGKYYYFCLHHVRIYNKQWDFFDGKSREDIEKFQKDSLYGHRKTRASASNVKSTNSNYNDQKLIEEELEKIFSRVSRRKEQIKKTSKALTSEHLEALNILQVDADSNWNTIKISYKKLAKSHHPDINTESDGEMLKSINQAYSILKGIYQV